MTELQVLCVQQMSISLAAFERDHELMKSGEIEPDPADTYDPTAVEEQIAALDSAIRTLCVVGGRSDL